jgi:inorganic pyrophosphatase
MNDTKRKEMTERVISLIGKEVHVIIDRPIGHVHKGIVYTQNYGYIEDFKALDGEYQDAYVIGVNEPIKSFTGKVIAVINRKDDVEDKLVVCGSDKVYSKEEIKEMVNFQEQFFSGSIIM